MKHTQKELIEEQDLQIDEISKATQRLITQGYVINNEINEQGKHINGLSSAIDNTTNKLKFVQKKLGKLLKTNGTPYLSIDMSQICTIVILFLISIAMVFLVIYT
jgi:adenine C2-methylase RlmN of 23S rRNA A2503 and tRNA A37